MRTMKIWKLAFAMLAAFSLASCSSDSEENREYQPAHRSAIINGVKMVLTDADGNNLCSQTETLSSLKIYGNLSGQYASTGNMREDGVMYIKFNADLPDERDIKYNEDKSIGTGTSTMTITVDGKTARLTFAFEISDNSNGEEMYGGNAIHVIGAQLGNKTVANEENGDMVIVLVVDEGGLTLSDEVPIPEEATATHLMADAPLANKVYLGSGYDVTGAYLSNDCLRENVIDLSTFDESDQPKIAAFSGTGSLVSGVDNAWGFLNGLRVAQGFTMEGEPGDVYFAGTFTDNPLFKEASERGDDYKFLMYIDRYIVYRHQLNGTHVLKKASMGLSILSLYRSGLKANTRDEDRFTASMFRRMKEVYYPIFWGITDSKATKGGALAVQCHGGNTQRLAAALARFPLTFEVSSAGIADWWNQSSEEKSDLSLAHLQDDDLIPIYKLIPDETKRAEVQRAVKAYIHSHQLN